MRTKFIYLITLVAALVSFSGLTSCKDTSEDDYNQLKTEVSSVSSSLQAQITKLQNLQTALQNKVDSLNTVYNANFATKTELNNLRDSLNTVLSQIKECSCDTAAVQANIDSLWTALGGMVSKDSINAAIDDYLNSTAAGSTNSVINNLIQQFLNNGNYATETWVKNEIRVADSLLQAQIDAIVTCNKKCNAFFNVEGYTLDSLIKMISKANQVALTAKTTADSALIKANEALQLAGVNSLRIDTLNMTVTTISSRLDTVSAKANAAYKLAEADSLAIVATNADLAKVHDTLHIISQAIVDSIAHVRADIAAALDSAKAYADQQDALLLAHIKQHCDSLNTLDLKIADLDAAYKHADSLLQDQIDSLVVKVNDLDTRLTAVETLLAKEIPAMKNRLDKIENALLKQVTGVIVQATQNQIFGGFNTPFGIKSNALLGWYGDCATGFDFPEAGYDYFLGTEANALNPEIQSYSDQLIDDEAAGKIYLTINPSNVDFSGVVLPLVNSQDKNSGIKLSPLQKSDYTIAFGYTRAADNGFYEATATFDNINEVQSLHFDKSAIVNDVKDLLDNVNRGNVKSLATDVAKIVANNVNNQLDANAIKVSYTDSIGDQEVTRNIYSEYNVATAIFHPLSFESMDGIADKLEGKEHFFGYDKVCSFIDRITDKIHFQLDDSEIFGQLEDLKLDLNNFDIKHIDAVELKEDTIRISVTIDDTIHVDGFAYNLKDSLNNKLYYEDENGDYHFITISDDMMIEVADQDYIIHYDISEEYDLTPLLNEMNGMVNDVNDIFDQLQGLINDANTIFATIDDYRNRVGNAIDNVHDRILNFIDRLEAPFLKLLHKSGKLLKPVMAVKSDNGYGIASQMRVKPTVVKGDVYLHPTTFNAELLAPAFKKYVAVTAVFDAAGKNVTTQALLQSLNTNGLNEVKSGSTTTLKLTGLQAGYTYKVAYIAVDYYGKQDGQVIYVKAN